MPPLENKMFALLISISQPSEYRNMELIQLEQVSHLTGNCSHSHIEWLIYGTIVLCLPKASSPALMDTCKFKSISINETESSNGASFQEGELKYTFSLQGPDCSVHSAHAVLYWNERCAAWLPGRVKSFWGIKEKLRWIHFLLVTIPSLIHLLMKGREW